MLTKPRVHNVFAGNKKDIRGLRFPEATLAETKDATRHNEDVIDIADVALMGVSFRSPVPLSPGRVHYLRLESHIPGIYAGQCTEFCGLSHAYMQMRVVALERSESTQVRLSVPNSGSAGVVKLPRSNWLAAR
jgi:hypothetical protein